MKARTQRQVEPAARCAGVRAYAPPRPGAPCDLRLDGNEGLKLPAELRTRLVDDGLATFREYPSRAGLAAQAAARWGVEPDRVLVTAGLDDALDRICRAVLEPGRNVLLPAPGFEMTERYARNAGAELRFLPWEGGAFPRDAALERRDDATGAIILASPNNPTGAVVSADDFRALADAAPQALVVADLAYVEFADADPTGALLDLPNLLVLRTLSKAWGMAGLRVGFTLGPARVLRWLDAMGQPYPVSGPSLAAASRVLDADPAPRDAFVARVREERAELAELLAAPGSQGNFAFLRRPEAPWLRDALAGFGIAVRGWGDGPLADALRVTCPGDADDFGRLRHALRTTLEPEAILFDMDGVLVNAMQSYREAIRLTVEHFGATVSFADIAAAKRAGGAADDWELSRNLLAARGVDVPLAEVTSKFEAFYQGTPGNPGLRENESFTLDRATLERWAARFPLGIVTARPRFDAEFFLTRMGIRDLFGVVDTKDDGVGKPDPAPVRRALAGLGVTRAWMIGDTPDDIRSARGAAVLPLGVLSPGESFPDEATAALLAAGAARVLPELPQLEELLP